METRVTYFVVALSLMVGLALGATPAKPTLTVDPDPATVDAGRSVVFTCTKATSETETITEWTWTGITTTIKTATLTYVAVTGDNTKQVKCQAKSAGGTSAESDAKTLTITAVPAPTLTSSITEADSRVTVDNGFSVKFTCTKNTAAKQDAVSFKFYKGADEITSSTTGASIAGGELTVTASSDWEAKVIKCEHYNAAAADSKKESTKTFTLSVKMVPNKPTISFTTPLEEDAELKATCAKTGDIAVTEFEIYEGSTKLTSTGTLKDTYTVAKVTKADHNGKKYKCKAKNDVGSSVFSDEKTLEVKAGAATQLVSMTTMALVLVLGAFFKE